MIAGRYHETTPLGEGNMGQVFRATDTRNGTEVAVKVLLPVYADDPTAIARLQREAELVAMLDSPYVVRLLDAGVDHGRPFLVMEYLPGPTLGEVLKERGRFPVAEALSVVWEIAEALRAAHAHGIVHRDLKPGNIKLVDGHVKVLDFGIGRAAGNRTLTVTGSYLGTPAYSAPERADGLGDIRSDIYSTGLILYALLAGHPPFQSANPWAILHAQKTLPVPALPAEVEVGVPPAVQEILERCLAKAPEDRYQTPAELSAAIADAQTGTGHAAVAQYGATQPEAAAGERTWLAPAGDDDETLA